MEVCILQGAEIHRTRELYEEVFQDSRAYTDYFYQKAEAECTAVVAIEDGQVIGEVFLVPKTIRFSAQWEKVFYVYGVATAEKHRGKGIMRAMLSQAEAYALQEKVTLLYLIPVDEKIYAPLNYQLVKKGCVKNYELSGKESKTVLQSVSVSEKFPYEEFWKLEREVYDDYAVCPMRDASFLADRLRRLAVEDGDIRAFYENTTGKLKGIVIFEERQGTPAIVDIICREADKEALIQCYLKEEKLTSVKEYQFPVMMKSLEERLNILEAAKVYINDEI